MKTLYILLLIILANISQAQITNCRDTTVQTGQHLQQNISCDTILYADTCFDTTGTTIQLTNCQTIKTGIWPFKKRTKVCDTAIIPNITVNICTKDSIHCNTTSSWIPDYYTYQICDTVQKILTTQFGAKITNGTFADQDKALKAMGVNVVRPNGITLSTWMAGSKTRLDDFLNAGYTCIVNVSWDEQTPNSIVPFYTNIANYTTKFDALVKQYADWGKKGKLIFSIENEEFNKGYFSGPIEDYINLFNAAVNVCIKYDVPVTDGALAEEYVNMIATNSITSRYVEQTTKISKLIAAFKAITYSKFTVNVHRTFSGSSYTGNDIVVACNYIRSQTGHAVLTNEYHLTNAMPSLLYDIVPAWKNAGVIYSLIWDESKDQGGAITDGSGNLTTLGTAYGSAIK